MKEKFESWGYERSAPAALAVAMLLCVGFASSTQVFAQRAGRPPSGQQLEGTPILPAGTRVIPDGTILIIEMETELNSGEARVSDRFIARIATPVVDANARTLLPSGAIVEGHVASVKKARWGHRSGELGLAFDYIDLGYGRKIPLRATIVSGESNPVNEEGDLKAKSARKRDILVTSGGAVAGAGVGMLTGASILAGGGAGAAAGLTVVLVMKGKNVDIDVGERFNLELVQPLSVTGGSSTGTRGRRPVQLHPPRARTTTPRPSEFGPPDDPNSVRTQWSRVPVYDASAQRGSDGLLRVTVTAETSTDGWRIYTHHEKPSSDTLDIRLMGIPPSQYGVRRIAHPSAPAVSIDDRNSAIRRIVIRGLNGAKTLSIGAGATSARLDTGSQYGQAPPPPAPRRPGTRPRPSGGTYDDYPPSRPPSGNLASLAGQTANQVEVVKALYAAQIGLWMDEQGTQLPGTRKATANERLLYDTLISLQTSARSLASTTSSSSRQRAGQQIQRETQSAQQLWQRVRSSNSAINSNLELDRRWQDTYNNLRALSSAATR